MTAAAKVYMIACAFPPVGRGNALTNACVANGLSGFFDMHVVCTENASGVMLSYQRDQSLFEGLDPRLDVRYVRAHNWLGLNEVLYAVGVLPCYYLNWAMAVWRQRRQIFRERGVIFAVYPVFSNLVLGYWLRRKLAFPLLVDFRDDFSGVMSRGWRRALGGLYRRMESRILRVADHVTVTTEALRQDLIARHGLDEARISVVYNVVPPFDAPSRTAQARTKPLVIAYAGAISSVQRPEVLLHAYSRLCSRVPEAREHVVVDIYGPESPYFKVHVRKYLVDGTSFRGFVDRAKLLESLSQAHLGFLSLASDTFAYATPTKLFELIELGVPMVAVLPSGEARKLIESEGLGLVADPGDVEALSRCIESLVYDLQLWERCRVNILRVRESFRPEPQIQKWQSILQTLSGEVCPGASQAPLASPLQLQAK